jgi:hypothetical protein
LSTALAVATTSRVLSGVIDDAVAAARLTMGGILGAATTSTAPPDHIVTGIKDEVTHLNLFLYHVTYNQGWREAGLPTRGSDGKTTNRAPLAIDLHYLLSAYSGGDYEAQILLGIGMQALHEMPVLFRQKIQNVFAAPANPIDKALATSELAGQLEIVKITPQQLGTDELSKLWTSFQSKFRVSAAYAVSVMLIETKAPSVAPLPVLQRSLIVLPYSEPRIDAVDPQLIVFAPGATLRLSGSNLLGRNTVAIFGGNPSAPQAPTPIDSGAQVTVTLPALAAGVNTVRLVRQIDLGVNPKTSFVESNDASFILQPVIRRAAGPPNDYLIQVGAPDNSVAPPIVPITVRLAPPITVNQKIAILLYELKPPAGQAPRSYLFDAEPQDLVPPDKVTVRTRGVAAGNYLLRVRVDGADSPLDIDPMTKAFNAPKVAL